MKNNSSPMYWRLMGWLILTVSLAYILLGTSQSKTVSAVTVLLMGPFTLISAVLVTSRRFCEWLAGSDRWIGIKPMVMLTIFKIRIGQPTTIDQHLVRWAVAHGWKYRISNDQLEDPQGFITTTTNNWTNIGDATRNKITAQLKQAGILPSD